MFLMKLLKMTNMIATILSNMPHKRLDLSKYKHDDPWYSDISLAEDFLGFL